MKRSKQTKKALISSTLALVLCFVMLLGTTFAWFTDNASTSVNKVQAGTLGIKLEMWDSTANNNNGDWVSAEGKALEFIKASAAAENEQVLWEPGASYKLPKLRVTNDGNLAVKYKVVFTSAIAKSGDEKLADVLDVSIATKDKNNANSSKSGFTLSDVLGANYDTYMVGNLTAGQSEEIEITMTMQTSAGNTYQGMTINGIAITVLATQYTYESDSNGTDYDKNAEYPTYVTSGLDTSSSTSSNKGDLSEVITGVKNGYRVNGGNYVASGTLLTFEETYDSVLVNDAEIVCDTLVVLDVENTVILQNCDITIAKGGKLVVNNTGSYQQICFSNVTINGVAVTRENVSSIVSTYCTGELTGMVY